MKTKYIFALILFLFMLSCKKDSETVQSGNFIEINGDRRIIDATNENVTFEYGTWGEPGWQYIITDNQFSTGIAGLPNNNLEIIITIWDSNLSKNNYEVVDSSDNKPTGYAQALLILSKKSGAVLSKLRSFANAGNVKYSVINSIKTVEFSKIKLGDGSGTTYSVSGRMEFYGYPHNTHW